MLVLILGACAQDQKGGDMARGVFAKLSAPEQLHEGETFTAKITVHNGSAEAIVLTAASLSGVSAQSFRGLQEITYPEELRGPEARAPRQIPTGYCSAWIVPPGKSRELQLRAKAVRAGKATAKVTWAPVARERIHIQEGGLGKPTFRKLGQDEAIPEIAALRSDETLETKTATDEGAVNLRAREYSLDQATKDAGLKADHVTYYQPSGHWVISDGKTTAFCLGGKAQTVRGNYVALLETIDLAGAKSETFSGMVEDKNLHEFLSGFLTRELQYKGAYTSFSVETDRMVEFILGADGLGYAITDRSWKKHE